MPPEREQNRDLTLPPDTFLYLQNVGKGGLISVYRGPTVVNQTGQDQPVRYDAGSRTYIECSLDKAVQHCARANEGDYIILENPTQDGTFPQTANQQARELLKGRKVIIPGPWCETPWPGQVVTVIEGHILRSNQYLVAIIYNAEQAQKNWVKTTVVQQIPTELTDEQKKAQELAEQRGTSDIIKSGLPVPESFAVGTRIVIRGSNVSFYIPCTGVEVVKDQNNKYVRDAETLQQMQFSCLVDESGKKEYPRGPMVVFPRPTQVFDTDNKGRRKFSPIELNRINGIHLKVTANFEGPDIENDMSKVRKFEEGTELFVTGKTLSIYYPREELAIIEYGTGNKKHYSTAIPEGEARYVINRESGEIGLIRGPRMFLADPRKEIPVRRILSQEECSLWYPGNQEAASYNAELAQVMAVSPSGRSGSVSEGDYRKYVAKGKKRSLGGPTAGAEQVALLAMGDDLSEEAGDTISRGTTYTQPRSIVLNTKYDGVPKVEIWSGYAILIVGAEGERKVVEGPQVILLEYDQKLGFMELSTGKPKNTDKPYRTSYLCIHNNQVSDIVPFESIDHVKGKIKISMRVNFEGDTEEQRLRWFSVSNYVKLLCDHVRSMVGAMTKRLTVDKIKAQFIDLVQECILSGTATQTGLYFDANCMRVIEVEVLELTLDDTTISGLLNEAQQKIVKSNIGIEQQRKELEAVKERELLLQETLRVQQQTAKVKAELEQLKIASDIELLAAKLELTSTALAHSLQTAKLEQEVQDFNAAAALARSRKEAEHISAIDRAKLSDRIQEMTAATDSAVKRFQAAKDGLYEVLCSLSRDDLAAKLAEGCTIERYLSGENISNSIANLMSVSPMLKGFFDKVTSQQETTQNRLKSPQTTPTR